MSKSAQLAAIEAEIAAAEASMTPEERLATQRAVCARSLPMLAQALGYERQGPWSPFHREMMRTAQQTVAKHLLLVPRGHLKTSLVSVCYPLHRILADPNVRVLVASATATLAEGILREIKARLERHLLFERVVDTGPGAWTAESVTVKRNLTSRTPTIRAVGVGGTVTGEHYDVIILDDVVDVKNTATKDLIDKSRDWYRMLLPLLEPGGQVIIIGTRYHYADLYGDLLGEHEETREMAEDVVAYVRQAVEGGKSIWPEKFTLEKLGELKAQMGSYLYGSQYLNDPTDPESAILRRDQIRWTPEHMAPPAEECTRVTVTDWAMSEKTTSDYTVFATVDVDRQARKWVRKLTRGRWGPDRQAEAIDAACRHLSTLSPARFAVQKSTLDRAIGANLRIRAAELRLPLPLVELSIHEASKFDRIIGLQPDFEGGRWFFVQGCLDGLAASELEDEITRFPKAPHDDILDALADVDRVAEQMPVAAHRDLPRRSTSRRY
jgi:hypothetical protein